MSIKSKKVVRKTKELGNRLFALIHILHANVDALLVQIFVMFICAFVQIVKVARQVSQLTEDSNEGRLMCPTCGNGRVTLAPQAESSVHATSVSRSSCLR